MSALGKMLFSFIMLLLFSIGGLIAWVIIAPRDVTPVANYMLAAFQNKLDLHNTIEIGTTTLLWDAEAHKIIARISDINLSLEQENYLYAEQINLKWDLSALLLGDITHVDVSISPINWQHAHSAYVANFADQLQNINQYLQKHARQLKKLNLTLTDVLLPLPSTQQVMVKKLSFKPMMVDSSLLLQVKALFAAAEYKLELAALLDSTHENKFSVKGKLQGNIQERYPISGEFNLTMPTWQEVDSAKFKLNIGTAQFDGSANYHGSNLKANVQLNNEFPIAELWYYWPTDLLSGTRTWLEKHIQQGILKAASMQANINLDSLQKEKCLQKKDIDAKVLITGAQLQYHHTSPPLQKAVLGLDINGEGMMLTLHQGAISAVKLRGTKAEIKFTPSLEERGIALNAQLNGSVQDSVNLAYLHINQENKIFKEMRGQASTKVNVFVPFIDDLNLEDLDIAITSQISGLSIAKFLQKYDLQNGELKLNLSGKKLSMQGTADYKGKIPLQIDYKMDDLTNTQEKITLQLMAENAAGLYRSLDMQVPEFVHGVVKATLNLSSQQEIWHKDIRFDLSGSTVALHKYGIYKPADEQAMLTMKFPPSKLDDWQKAMYNLHFAMLQSSGEVEFDQGINKIQYLASKDIDYKGGKLQLTYDARTPKNTINISGERLDLSGIDWFNLKESKQNSPDDISINGQLQTIKMKNDVVLLNPSFHLHCVRHECRTMNLNAEMQDGGAIKIETDYDFIFVKSNNAGRALAAFNVSNNIQGGSIDISGAFDDKARFNGHAYIQQFALKKTSIFTKLLLLPVVTATSIFNIRELFDGSKIAFDVLHCPIHYAQGKVLLRHCVQKSKSLLIKGSGYIDLDRNHLDAQGVIAPRNVIDKILSAIPIIGATLTGRNKEGALAISYSISGPLRDPKIRVNPLSMLTPGMTRDIFQSKDGED